MESFKSDKWLTIKSNLEAKGTGILSKIRKKTNKFLVAIGRLSKENMKPVFQDEADGVAVISALVQVENGNHSIQKKIGELFL